MPEPAQNSKIYSKSFNCFLKWPISSTFGNGLTAVPMRRQKSSKSQKTPKSSVFNFPKLNKKFIEYKHTKKQNFRLN